MKILTKNNSEKIQTFIQKHLKKLFAKYDELKGSLSEISRAAVKVTVTAH